jgi:enoyl-CoA hydratase
MSELAVKRHGGVCVIRYANPPRNFMTLQMLEELRRLILVLDRDPEVRVIVLTGATDGNYIIHDEADELDAMIRAAPPRALARVLLPVMRALLWVLGRSPRLAALALRPARARTAIATVMLLFDAIERCRKVTIAAINGPCIGGGLELSLCFDYRVAIDDDNALLGLPEVLIGLMPGFGGTQRLARTIGTPRARELLLMGELVTPRQAVAAGLVSNIIAPAHFQRDVLALAERLARRPPLAVAAIKRALVAADARRLRDGLFVELAEVSSLARSRDTRAGMRAYTDVLRGQLALPVIEQWSLQTLLDKLDRAELTTFVGR